MNIASIKKTAAGLAAAALALSLTACGGDAAADAPERPDAIRIAYLPNEEAAHVADARASIAAELSEWTGLPVEEFITTDYAAMVEAMRLGHVDLAFFGPLSFTRAHDRAGAVPMAQFAPQGDPTLSEIRSIMIVRSESDIYTLDDVEGRTMAFVDPDSTTGTLLPANALIDHFADRNFSIDDLQTNGRLFDTVLFSGGHAGSLNAVLMGDVDIAAISSRFVAAGIERGEIGEDELRIIYATDVVPGNTLAARPGLGEELLNEIREFLWAFENETFFYGFQGNADLRFVPTQLSDFQELIDLDARLSQ